MSEAALVCEEEISAQCSPRAEYYRAWKEANRDKVREYKRTYYKNHREAEILRTKNYYQEHKDDITRKEAKRLNGRKYYHTHRDVERERRIKRCLENRPIDHETSKKWRALNKEKIKATTKKYYAENSEKIKEKLRIWSKEHPEAVKRNRHEYRAKKQKATIEHFFPSEIYERDGWVCQLCHKKVNKRLKYPNLLSASLDHIVPLSKGGEHSRKNVHLAHLICNMKAHTSGEKQIRLF